LQTIHFSDEPFSNDSKHFEEKVMRKLDRREFVIGAGGAALAGAASPAKVFAQPRPPQLAMRRPIGSMQPNDPALASYIRAVERMKALPASDPRSWNRIAQIHVDFCPHGNWFFLPWHRAYLVMFERICRQMSGDQNFALPYWDWTAQPQMPAAFTAATLGGRRNPLFDNTRQIRPGASIPNTAVGSAVIARVMAETNFELFGSTRPTGQNSTEARWLRAPGRTTQLEGGPHNITHATIGGDMGQMISPRDPIFWLHHCNVDHMWARWNALGRRNATSPLWATFQFNGMFQVPQGQGQALTAFNTRASDMLDHRAWGYTYPDVPGGSPSPGADQVAAGRPDGQVAAGRTDGQVAADATADLREMLVLATQAPTGGARLNRALSTRLDLPEALQPTRIRARAGEVDPNAILKETPLAPAPAPTPPSAAPGGPGSADPAAVVQEGRIFSVLESARATKGNAMTVNVFLNHPNPTANTPADDPHFVGAFGLFGLESHAAHGGMNMQVELTETLAKLRQENRALGRQFDVQLVPVETRGGDDLELNVERINIAALR
jgi:tyrosinase